jgi:hypothetical protein
MARELAQVTDYDQLIEAFYARAEQIGASRAALDEAANFPDGYMSKLLGRKKVRRIGADSLGPLLRVLGIRLVVVEDPVSLAKYTSKLTPRQERLVRHRNRQVEAA